METLKSVSSGIFSSQSVSPLGRKKAMEAELLRSKTELMLLNNQLLEAVQKRLELSLELEAWKVRPAGSPRLAKSHTHSSRSSQSQTCGPVERTSPLTPQLTAHNANYDWNLTYVSVAFVCRGAQHERGPAHGVCWPVALLAWATETCTSLCAFYPRGASHFWLW